MTGTPTTVRTTYGAIAPDRMDVYLPADAAPNHDRPGLVLSLGVHAVALDHPDIVRVAQGIARLGVVVGVPDPSALRDTRITPEEPGQLADAVLVLAARPEVDPDRVGLAGLSAGASVALVAGADPRIADQLRFISAFGGFADAETLLVDIATRTTELGGSIGPCARRAARRGGVVPLPAGHRGQGHRVTATAQLGPALPLQRVQRVRLRLQRSTVIDVHVAHVRVAPFEQVKRRGHWHVRHDPNRSRLRAIDFGGIGAP